MTTPHEAARPVAYQCKVHHRAPWTECDEASAAKIEENGFAVRALYTAADYDALRAERDSWHEAACEMAKREAATRARAEAAEAKLSEVIERIASEWDDCEYDAPGCTIDVGAAIRRAALNEGEGNG